MRKGTVVGAVATAGVALSVGVAVAANISCDGGQCEGTDGPDVMQGTNERDVMFGRGNRDEMFAHDGVDDLHGNGSGDTLCGDQRGDFYNAGKQSDILAEDDREICENNFGASGITDSSGPDTMLGGRGTDFAEGSDGGDEIRGMGGSDIVGSGQEPRGVILLFGEDGNDEIHGGKKADGISGDQGRDQLFGGQGFDFIDARDCILLCKAGQNGGDFVDCGPGVDEARVDENDTVRNCERVNEPSNARATTSQAEARAAFLEQRGY